MNHPIAASLNSFAVEEFQRRLADAWPARFWIEHRVLVAVSGGPDSVALLRAAPALAMTACGKLSNLAVANVNHGLRGRESDQDQEFVEGRKWVSRHFFGFQTKNCCWKIRPMGSNPRLELRATTHLFRSHTKTGVSADGYSGNLRLVYGVHGCIALDAARIAPRLIMRLVISSGVYKWKKA